MVQRNIFRRTFINRVFSLIIHRNPLRFLTLVVLYTLSKTLRPSPGVELDAPQMYP